MAYSFSERRAGVLLHPTSLPSGTLEDGSRWLDFLAEAKLGVWQVLPLGVPQDGDSPYQCLSAFATNPALLSSYPPIDESDSGFAAFCQQESHWLEDFALFSVIKQQQQGAAWFHWPNTLRQRRKGALEKISEQHATELAQLKWEQYRLHLYWQQLRKAARERNIGLFGDMPIFVAHDSADVWACPHRFLLDAQGMPTWVTGVPPDYFSSTGQRWGNPHYDWDYHKQEDFAWWLARLHHHFQWFDLVRIDHFRGLQAVWMIDAHAETAVDGHWQEVPGDALLAALHQEMDGLPLVAEDLGIITPEVTALKEKYDLPGMAVLQFAYDAFEDNPHKPQNIVPNTVVYTGTHDNDTTLGWFQSQPEKMREHIRSVLGVTPWDDAGKEIAKPSGGQKTGAAVVDAMLRTALCSRANLAMAPLQDYLKLGSEARMNTPGTTKSNWQWQFHWEQLTENDLASYIRQLVSNCDRNHSRE